MPRRAALPAQELVSHLRRDLDPLDAAARSHRPDDEPLLEVVRAASFVAFLLTAVWVVWSPLPQIQVVIGIGMFSLWMVVVFYFLARVRYNLRAANAHMHLNPFLSVLQFGRWFRGEGEVLQVLPPRPPSRLSELLVAFACVLTCVRGGGETERGVLCSTQCGARREESERRVPRGRHASRCIVRPLQRASRPPLAFREGGRGGEAAAQSCLIYPPPCPDPATLPRAQRPPFAREGGGENSAGYLPIHPPSQPSYRPLPGQQNFGETPSRPPRSPPRRSPARATGEMSRLSLAAQVSPAVACSSWRSAEK